MVRTHKGKWYFGCVFRKLSDMIWKDENVSLQRKMAKKSRKQGDKNKKKTNGNLN